MNVILKKPVQEVEAVAVEVLLAVVNMTDIPLLGECTSQVSIYSNLSRDTQKATNQGWGNEATSWESAAPIAEADRNEEKKDADEPTTATEDGAPAAEQTGAAKEPEKEVEEEEEQTQTYADWLASKSKSDFQINEVRKPDQSKWEAATSVLNKKARALEETVFGETSAQKTRSTSSSATKKSAPKKVVLEIEQRFTPIRSGRGSDRGGRGGERGGRGGSERGEYRGGRGRGEGGSSAPRGRGRGEDRGGRGRGGASTRGSGGRGGSQTIDVADTNAFPALG